MSVKLIMTWDIARESEQKYFEFVVREFIPSAQRLGFDLTGAYATVYGDHPQILVEAVIPSEDMAHQLLDSSEWKNLHTQLMDYVVNYSQKLVVASGGFQF